MEIGLSGQEDFHGLLQEGEVERDGVAGGRQQGREALDKVGLEDIITVRVRVRVRVRVGVGVVVVVVVVVTAGIRVGIRVILEGMEEGANRGEERRRRRRRLGGNRHGCQSGRGERESSMVSVESPTLTEAMLLLLLLLFS